MSSIARRLVTGSWGSLITRVAGTGLAFGAHAFVARLAGEQVYGDYFFALTTINILALAGKLGLDTATLRFVPTFVARKEWGLLHGFYRRVGQLSWSLSIALGGITAIVVFLLGRNIESPLRLTLLVACIALPLTVVLQVRSAGIQAFKRVVLAQIPPEVVRFIALAAIVSIMFLGFDSERSPFLVMAAEVASLLVAVQLSGILFRFILPGEAKLAIPSFETKHWVATALPLSLIGGLFVVLNQTGVLLVGFLSDTTQAGVFGVAARIATLIGFGLNAVNSIAAPMISELYWGDRKNELQRMIGLAALGLFAFSVPVWLGIIILGKWMLSFFGPAFVEGYPALVVLACGQLANALAGPTGFLMTMTGHQRAAARIVGVGVVINIVVSFALIPPFGLLGGAIATAAAMVFWNAAMYTFVRKRLDLDSTMLRYFLGRR